MEQPNLHDESGDSELESGSAQTKADANVASTAPAKAKRPMTEAQKANLEKGRRIRDERRKERLAAKSEVAQLKKKASEENDEVRRLKKQALEKLVGETVDMKLKLQSAVKEVEKKSKKRKREKQPASDEDSSSSSSDDEEIQKQPKKKKPVAPTAAAKPPVAAKPRIIAI